MKRPPVGSWGIVALAFIPALVLCRKAPDQNPRYGSPEALLADYENAVRSTASKSNLDRRIIEYAACRSFKERSVAFCDKVDGIIAVKPPMLSCRGLFATGMMYKDFIAGSDRTENCVMETSYWNEVEAQRTGEPPHDDPADIAEFCRNAGPYFAQGDVKGFCELEASLPSEGDHMRSSLPECMKTYVHFHGKPELCRDDSHESGAWTCRSRAQLIKALREGNPGQVAGTIYGPLVSAAAACDGFSNSLLGSL